MAEFNIRSDAVDVEQIMAQIRSRIREKRGVDYTEEEIRELESVKLERFLDPKNVRSDLLEHYRQRGAAAAEADAPPFPGEFDPSSVYNSARPGVVGRLLYMIRRLLNPVLKLCFNPAPLLESVSVQSRNVRRATTVLQERTEIDALTYEVMNNLVVEMTRLAIDMKNHKMRVESVAARLDFDERRSRALEETVQQQRKPAPPAIAAVGAGAAGGGRRATAAKEKPLPSRQRRRHPSRRRRRHLSRRRHRHPSRPQQSPARNPTGTPGRTAIRSTLIRSRDTRGRRAALRRRVERRRGVARPLHRRTPCWPRGG